MHFLMLAYAVVFPAFADRPLVIEIASLSVDEHRIYISRSYFSGFKNKDVAFLHQPSKTLIQADLLMNLPCKEQVKYPCFLAWLYYLCPFVVPVFENHIIAQSSRQFWPVFLAPLKAYLEIWNQQRVIIFLNVKHNHLLTSIAGPCDETLKQSQGGILTGLYLVTAYVTFSSMFVG
jgi:hypothetical protein